MQDLLLLFIGAALVNNVVLVKFLGLCPFMGASRSLSNSIGLATATSFVMTLAAALSWMLEAWLLRPFDALWLRTPTYILAIACVVQFTELLMARSAPLLHRLLGLYLPLITTNCAVLGIALLSAQQQLGFAGTVISAFGAAAGFSLVLILFSSLRERMDVADVPAPFRGSAIALITAALMSLAFMGFSGWTR